MEKEKVRSKRRFKYTPLTGVLCIDLVVHSIGFLGGGADIRDALVGTLSDLPTKVLDIGKSIPLSREAVAELVESKDQEMSETWNGIESGDILTWLLITPSEQGVIEANPDDFNMIRKDLREYLAREFTKNQSFMRDVEYSDGFFYGVAAKKMAHPRVPLFHMAFVEKKTDQEITIIHSSGLKAEGVFRETISRSKFREGVFSRGGVVSLKVPEVAKEGLIGNFQEKVGNKYDEFSAKILFANKLLNTSGMQAAQDKKFNCTELIVQSLQESQLIPKEVNINAVGPLDLIGSGVLSVKGATLARSRDERWEKMY